jgi:hypothetical protein
MGGAIGLLVMALALGLLVAFAAQPGTPVRRARVARFARRLRLRITPDNGNQVVAYLATTRRWRIAGVVTALAGYAWVMVVLLERDELTAGVLQILSGWFVGALIAEARLAQRPAGERRSASLRPRDPAHYLSAAARLALPTALAVSLILGVATLAAGASGEGIDGRGALLAQLAAVAVAAAVWTIRRRVLVRPQPADLPPDRRAADDAIRSHSLHVLAGAGAALVLYAVSYQLAALGELIPPAYAGMAIVALAAPVLGWLVATASWPVRRYA